MAVSHLRQARRILAEAGRHHADAAWHLVVRRAQEAVELALKALLRSAGVEVPHVHDVGVFLADHQDRLPGEIRGELERLVSVSRRLRREREVSFYGDEETGAPPERLYSRPDAEEALRDGHFVVDLAGRHVAT
jgi:HEPN domain-containing protein